MNANIMNRSELIFHIVAVVTLTIVAILFWNITSDGSYVEGKITSDVISEESVSTIYGQLYRTIPILCGVILFSIVISFYLEEWLQQTSWLYQIIEGYILILAKVPSLVFGILAVYFILFHSQKITYLSLLLSGVLLVMPVSIRSTQTAIQTVDMSVREAAYALGATRWRVVTGHVLPRTFPVILAVISAAISRILAIAALLISIISIYASNSLTLPKNVFVLISCSVIVSVLSSLLGWKGDSK